MNSDYRKIAEGMIEFTYGEYKHWEKGDDPFDLYDYLPVWKDMDYNTKCSAIEYVYKNREEIELHSQCVESWVQATAYFMIDHAMSIIGDIGPELFFDDMDFTMDSDILSDSNVQEQMGISTDFTEKF